MPVALWGFNSMLYRRARMRGLLRFFLALLLALPCGGLSSLQAGPVISAPLDGAVFPRDFAPPVFRWSDDPGAQRWRVVVRRGMEVLVSGECSKPEWRPSAGQWDRMKAVSLTGSATFRVESIGSGGAAGPAATIAFRTSVDPAGASIFYREVPLPVGFAMDNKPLIRWRVGDVSSADPPRTVLAGMKTCANCHSFTADGKTLAMDIDFGPDKSTYAITNVEPDVQIARSHLIAWNDYRREDGQQTLGLMSSISPDGRYVVSTVKETIVLRFMPDPNCSQLFFPIRGILAVHDRVSGAFRSLPGADDPEFVQTNPAFSPDGRWLVFARARVPDVPRKAIEAGPGVGREYEDGRRKILYDLYRVPFNDGRGGPAEPILGASANERSNFFARFSPDGRWIIFCQASSMMLNRPDASLHVIPAAGGVPRRLRCNAQLRMNSWHSFSPNGHWLVYSSKASGPMTQLWLTHIDSQGEDTTPVMLEGWVEPGRAANLPEFVKLAPGHLRSIRVREEIQRSISKLPRRPE